jgi:hypothetical protein
MSDVTLACDETAATRLVHDAETIFGTKGPSGGSGSFGPFVASYSASVSFSGGTVGLQTPNIIALNNIHLNYSLSLSFGIDLNSFLPHFCLPQVCVNIPCVGKVCTPSICISWPTKSISLNYSDFVDFSADFQVIPHLSGSNWLIDIRIVSIPNLTISPAAAAILTALGLAVGAVLVGVPFIGPFLAAAVEAILAAIGIAGVTGLLGPLLTLFVSGLTFTIYNQPQVQQVLPSSGPHDPAVSIKIAALDCVVQQTDKAELVATGSIAP